MSNITLPDNNFRSIEWRLSQPTQQNRSEFTGARQVMQLPGAAYWKASAEHVPVKGEANIRPWRAFFAKLLGQVNTFHLPATEGDQVSSNLGFVLLGTKCPMTNIANTTVATGSVTRSLAYGGTYSAGAQSTSAVSIEGLTLSFELTTNVGRVVVGINKTPAAVTAPTDIPYGWLIDETGQVYTYEAGLTVVAGAVYSAGERLEIFVPADGSEVRYLRNRTVVRTQPTPSAGSYYVDVSIADPLTVKNIYFGTATAGARTFNLRGLPVSTTWLSAGSRITVLLDDGVSYQLLEITEDVTSDADGCASVTVEPMIRGLPFSNAQAEAKNPFCVMAMDSPELGYAVDPGALYGFGISATEAY